jgi:subtilisin family serine protease
MLKKRMLTLLSTAVITAVAALSVPTTVVIAAPAKAAAAANFTNNAYIVRLAEKPVVAFDGGIKGFAATKPRKGQKIDPNSPQVADYMRFLESRQDAVLASVGGAKKLQSYGVVFNGFAAELTAAQAEKLAATSGVLAVTKDEFRSVDTATTPAFLGLSGANGVWNNTGITGEDVIIGIIDSGVWPEHPSFSDRTGTNGNGTQDGKLSYRQIPGWHGRCVPGEEFNASNCNQKLIGARFYNAGFGGNAGIDANLPFEFNSPRDHNGHGTHTATTAGGNAGVAATGAAAVFGSINGIAPRARIAAYKACWSVPGTAGSCSGVDLLAAIDQAVADGVDVINYSISGTRENFRDPVEIAFLFAADAGVFVAASAGNSGPDFFTVAHPSPWITTVAAGTHNRDGKGSTTLGNSVTYTGASVATAVAAKPLIDSTAAGLPGADSEAVRLCFSAEENGGPAVLDPAKVAGKVVVCDRGVNARVDKSLAVQQAGGLGMILVNTSASSLNADFHFVPTVHLQNTDRAAVKAYAATAGATAAINQATIVLNAPAPFTASFSSRGPLLAGNGDLLKPDIIAPGQDILAGVAPPNNSGRLFDLYSGTSMSSPHVAGLAALFKQKYPTWSPMAIKSALMTSAGDVLDGPNTNPVVIFRQGAGHVKPAAALNPGLVYDSGFSDWLSFICAVQPGGGCTGVTPTDPSNLNVASIAIGDMAGTQTVTRTVTNVSGKLITLTPSVAGMSGFDVTVSKPSLTLAAGQKGSYSVTITRTTAALNAYAGGQLTWSNPEFSVRSPIVVRPVALGAPAEVSGSYNVTFGYTGSFSATPRGLVPSVVDAGSVSTGQAVDYAVTIPAGTTYARFAMFDADVSPAADIDLEVYNEADTLVASSGGATSTETANLLNPAAGTYTVRVIGFATGAGAASYKLHTFILGSDPAGNMTVGAPANAVVGQTGTIAIGTSGLAPATKYLGSVVYGGAASATAPTIVRIDTP